jgi:hypothetical protein
MSVTAADLRQREGKPAYIEFETVSVELPTKSLEEGRYVAMDQDMVTVRQIGSNDSVKFVVADWLRQNKIEVVQGRLDPRHADLYEESYKRWKAGQDLPVTGTPIKTWPVVSPAQVATLLNIHVRTVEDLATLNDEGLKRLGMGAISLKQKAEAWLAQAQDKGPLTMKLAQLEQENALLKSNLEAMHASIEELKRQQPEKPSRKAKAAEE